MHCTVHTEKKVWEEKKYKNLNNIYQIPFILVNITKKHESVTSATSMTKKKHKIKVWNREKNQLQIKQSFLLTLCISFQIKLSTRTQFIPMYFTTIWCVMIKGRGDWRMHFIYILNFWIGSVYTDTHTREVKEDNWKNKWIKTISFIFSMMKEEQKKLSAMLFFHGMNMHKKIINYNLKFKRWKKNDKKYFWWWKTLME